VPETLVAFTASRRPAWDDLAALVSRARRRGGLDRAEVRRLGLRYREAVADLAVARRRFAGDPVTEQLDRLVADARGVVYGQLTERRSFVRFATTGYWQRVRERPRFLLAAAVALWVPMGLLGLWAHANPADAARVAAVSPLSAGLAEGGVRNPDTEKITDVEANTALSAEIFTNNARVALVAYAGGLTGGVLTLVALVFNGMLVGLIAGYAVQLGAGEAVWRLIVPHGVLELSLITVAGAAGLRTGWALLRPGHRTRAQALADDGRAGLELAAGSALLLVPCGLVEGFVTPRGLSTPMALLVGFGLAGTFWAMVLWRGRPDPVGAAPPARPLTGEPTP
jgi:uncharacterized membrane protein SpoIIM required for sporulation